MTTQILNSFATGRNYGEPQVIYWEAVEAHWDEDFGLTVFTVVFADPVRKISGEVKTLSNGASAAKFILRQYDGNEYELTERAADFLKACL